MSLTLCSVCGTLQLMQRQTIAKRKSVSPAWQQALWPPVLSAQTRSLTLQQTQGLSQVNFHLQGVVALRWHLLVRLCSKHIESISQ